MAHENLQPKYYTELHDAVLEILGEEKCKEISSIVGAKDTFSFAPIVIYLKRIEIQQLLSEGNLSFEEIAKKVNVCTRTVRIVHSLRPQKKLF